MWLSAVEFVDLSEKIGKRTKDKSIEITRILSIIVPDLRTRNSIPDAYRYSNTTRKIANPTRTPAIEYRSCCDRKLIQTKRFKQKNSDAAKKIERIPQSV